MKTLLAVVLVIFFGVTTLTRAAVWGEPAIHVITEASNHPLSPRANYGIGKQYAIYASSLEESHQKTEAIEKASEYFEKSAELRWSYTDGLFGLLMIEGLEGYEMNKGSYQSLLNRLENAPFSNNNYNYLYSILGCLEGGDCKIAKPRIASLIEACLNNSGFSGRSRSDILERYREYLK